MYSKKGNHVFSKFLDVPLRENLIFSSLRKYSTSVIHLLWVGGSACFHFISMIRLAKRVEKDITLSKCGGVPATEEAPNRAVKGSGEISTPEISLKDLKMADQ